MLFGPGKAEENADAVQTVVLLRAHALAQTNAPTQRVLARAQTDNVQSRTVPGELQLVKRGMRALDLCSGNIMRQYASSMAQCTNYYNENARRLVW